MTEFFSFLSITFKITLRGRCIDYRLGPGLMDRGLPGIPHGAFGVPSVTFFRPEVRVVTDLLLVQRWGPKRHR